MIRVNLLEDHTAHAHKRFGASAISGTGLICLAISLLTAAAMGIWRFQIQKQIAADIEKRTALRTVEAHLQTISKQIEEHHRTRQMRRRRIDGIEELREEQTEPVLLLNTILQGIPRDGDLWFTSLAQESDSIRIAGFALNTEAIPDLMLNLSASGVFDTVDLQGIESQREASKFSILCAGIRKTQVK